MKNLITSLLFGLALCGCAHHSSKSEAVVLLSSSEVIWEKLNPARGDKSPQAGTLWGDRKKDIPTAFLAKFVDGFSSPAHIHNVSYRAIVIEGLIHNDDPSAANMWMPKVSYWTQPAGEAHITSAKGEVNIALVEIDRGPYLVRPTAQKFDNQERPYNIHESNIIWRNFEDYKSADLWKNSVGVVTGRLLRFDQDLHLKTKESKLVLIKGKVSFNEKSVLPGSLISVRRKSKISVNCESKECVLYQKLVSKTH